MTTLSPTLINPVDAFAATVKPQWMKTAMTAGKDSTFQAALTDAQDRNANTLKLADDRRFEARQADGSADSASRRKSAERRERPEQKVEEDDRASDYLSDSRADESRSVSEDTTDNHADRSGEAKSDASQGRETCDQVRQDSAHSDAQQTAAPAQGLLGLQAAGEAGGEAVNAQQADKTQNLQGQSATQVIGSLADQAAAEEIEVGSSLSDAESGDAASAAHATTQAGDAAAAQTRKQTASMHVEGAAADAAQANPAVEAEQSGSTLQQRSAELTQPVEKPAVQQTNTTQQSADAAARLVQPNDSPNRGASVQEREGGGSGNQSSDQWRGAAQANSSTPAAVARAEQVDTAVRLENATSKPAAAEPGSRGTTTTATVSGTRTGNGVNTTQTTRTDEAASARSRTLSEAPFANKLIRGLTAMVNQRGGVMNMRLDPPDLGDLKIQMTISRGQVSAQFQVTTVEAQSMLEKSMSTLRAALESHGLTVERLHVQTPNSAQTQDLRDGSEQQQNQQARDQADAGGGQSRGRGQGEDGQDHRGGGAGPVPFAEAAAFAPAGDAGEAGGDQ